MDCLKMKQAAEYNMKSRCQRFSVQFFCLHGQPMLYLQSVFKVYISLALYVFDFLPLLLLLLLFSSASHVAGTPRGTRWWSSVSHRHHCAKERLRLSAEASGHRLWPGDLPTNLEQRLLLSGRVWWHYRQVQWVVPCVFCIHCLS